MYLTWSELTTVWTVLANETLTWKKIKCRKIITREIGCVSLSDMLYEKVYCKKQLQILKLQKRVKSLKYSNLLINQFPLIKPKKYQSHWKTTPLPPLRGNFNITDEIVLNVLVRVWLSCYILSLTKYLIVVIIQNIGIMVWFFSIYKSGLKEYSFNYRGISLPSCLGKFFNSIFCNRFQDKIENKNIMSHSQAGFRKGQRTSHYIFTLFSLNPNQSGLI